MPIAFRCPGCAKKYQVGDQMAGRRGKCQACNTAFVIPAAKVVARPKPAPETLPEPEPPPVQDAAPPPIPEAPPTVEAAPPALEPVAPPNVEAPLPALEIPPETDPPDLSPPDMPPPALSPPPELVAPPPEANPVPAEFESEEAIEEPPLPTRKGPRRTVPRWPIGVAVLLIAAGVAVLLIAAWRVWHFWPRSGDNPADEMKFFPNRTQLVLLVRVKDLINTPLWKDLQKDNPDLFKKTLRDLADRLGLPIEKIDHVAAALTIAEPAKSFGEMDGVVLVRATAAVNGPDLAAAMQPRTFEETKVGAYTVYKAKDGTAFAAPGGNIALLGSKPMLTEVLSRDKAELSTGLETALTKVERGQTIAFALNIVDLIPRAMLEKPYVPGETHWQSFNKVVCATGYVKIAPEITLVATILCDDDATATDIKAILVEWLPKVRTLLGNSADLKDVADWLEQAHVLQTGSTTTVTLTVRAAQIRDFVRKGGLEKLPPRSR